MSAKLVTLDREVEDILVPYMSFTEPTVILETSKSAEVSPAPTVYSPESVFPEESAVKVTVSFVLNVATNSLDEITFSEVVAVIVIFEPTP